MARHPEFIVCRRDESLAKRRMGLLNSAGGDMRLLGSGRALHPLGVGVSDVER